MRHFVPFGVSLPFCVTGSGAGGRCCASISMPSPASRLLVPIEMAEEAEGFASRADALCSQRHGAEKPNSTSWRKPEFVQRQLCHPGFLSLDQLLHVGLWDALLADEGQVRLQDARLLPLIELLAVDEIVVVAAPEEEKVLLEARGDALLDEAAHRRISRLRTDHDDGSAARGGKAPGRARVFHQSNTGEKLLLSSPPELESKRLWGRVGRAQDAY